MRLDKYLAQHGHGTRSEVRALIKAGRVHINGQAVQDAGFPVREGSDAVLLDGAEIAYQAALHIMLNKPAGILTAAEDSRHQTVMGLLPAKCAAMRCMPVGRLDIDTEGLLLLTTDGQLAHSLLAPKRHVDKVYYAQLDMPITDVDVAAFAKGLVLSDFTAQPARLTPLPDPHTAQVTLQEGKFHQVKRMFAACGKRVLYLKRLSFGGVTLDPSLSPGAWRELTAQELAALTLAAGGKPNE